MLQHHPVELTLQELHRDLLFGRGFRVLRGLPVPPEVSFECVQSSTATSYIAALAYVVAGENDIS